MQYLEDQHQEYATAFLVPDLVGAMGKVDHPYYLLDRWYHGQHAGALNAADNVNASDRIWKTKPNGSIADLSLQRFLFPCPLHPSGERNALQPLSVPLGFFRTFPNGPARGLETTLCSTWMYKTCNPSTCGASALVPRNFRG